MASKDKNTKQDTKDVAEVRLAIFAMEGVEHNPVDWGSIVRFTAPIIARLAARYATRYVASVLKKRVTLKQSNEVAEKTAERIAVVLAKKALKR
ncbi:hypothetical protein ES703_100247 [subsurface metagenome]